MATFIDDDPDNATICGRFLKSSEGLSKKVLPQPVSINKPVEERIAWADTCFRVAGELFFRDSAIGSLLSQLLKALKASRQLMGETGVVALCRECDQEEGGSCCGKGLENRYDPWLLLINRLLGVTLPLVRQQNDGCFFLGETGCLLMARHVICINYMCTKITRNVHPHLIASLREAEGSEIHVLFTLNERVKSVFRKWMLQQKAA